MEGGIYLSPGGAGRYPVIRYNGLWPGQGLNRYSSTVATGCTWQGITDLPMFRTTMNRGRRADVEQAEPWSFALRQCDNWDNGGRSWVILSCLINHNPT